ncbi:hypothetical protein H4R18_002332 [Coemansia javaensis]|uniref:Retinoic acid induced 16-like protein-domain-containing protein n=1 Tax=Coemansia javaensis TaxID=2761396 RepID=A0A9W8HC73_9FUNG|nr:hypothetical protein H4R18_002332 [Coemansia javaensis]
MEYFAKFTRHIGSPRKKEPGGGATQQARFERAWKAVQSACYYQSKWRGTTVDKTALPGQLEAMFDLLVQEDIQQADADDWATGACMEYLLGNGVLDELVRLAAGDQPLGVRGVVISNIATFISLADEKLLVQKAVHNPVLELLRWYGADDPTAAAGAGGGGGGGGSSRGSSTQRAYDSDFVALLYALCSKVRGDPALLNIFFQDRRWLKSVEQRSFSSESIAAMVRSTDSLRSGSGESGFEFPLFSHLLRFVHRDGEVGDTARTSLLFLLELATTEIMAATGGGTALEKFILDDSGFAAMLSATLGAMYSQLPRSLRVANGPAAVVPESFPSYSADLQNAIESSIFSAGAGRAGSPVFGGGSGAASSASPEFRACLASFVHLLGFIQDTLYRCPSSLVCSQLLANLRSNFLRTILYPSLLESSDTDDSSVAVMRYLEAMLQVARHEDLVGTIMNFLTDEDASGRRQAEPAGLPFTLRDLIHTNLQSSVSMPAVVSALNLLRLILTKHCRYSARLIEVERAQPAGGTGSWMAACAVAVDVHRQELDMYAQLMAQLQGDGGGDGGSGSGGTGHSGNDGRRGASEAPALHIPWRHTTPATPTLPGRQPRAAAMTESFAAGYDAYLEDAALDWDAHCAYHAELDALATAQSLQAARRSQSPPTPVAASGDTTTARQRQRQRRPRKYSEAVAAAATTAAATSSPGPDAAGGSPQQQQLQHQQQQLQHQQRAGRRARFSIKQSDPTIRALMGLLAKHFAQPRECNLALTGVLAALVGCPHRTLDPWFGFSLAALLDGVLSRPWAAWMDNLRNISDDDDADKSDSDSEGELSPSGRRQQHQRRRPGGAPAAALAAADASKYEGLDHELQAAIQALPSGTTAPSLYVVVGGLVRQAAVLRAEIPDFAHRLRRARNALMGVVEDADDLDEELEVSGSVRGAAGRGRDRGLSSASLENARSAIVSASPATAATGSPRSRSTSASGAQRAQPGSARARSGSAASATASTPAPAPAPACHPLGVPPANANLAEFIENVIILQESIKEIIARVQVRRENGGDENAIG